MFVHECMHKLVSHIRKTKGAVEFIAVFKAVGVWVVVVFLQAVAKMVQECYKYVDSVSDLTVKLRLIDTLRTVTAGKVRFPAGFQSSPFF